MKAGHPGGRIQIQLKQRRRSVLKMSCRNFMLEVHRASRTSPHRLLFFKLNHPSSFNIASEVFSNDLNIFITPIRAVRNITHSGRKDNCWRRVRTFGITSRQTSHLTSLTLRSLSCKMETSLPCLSQKLLWWKNLVCARCTLCVQNA